MILGIDIGKKGGIAILNFVNKKPKVTLYRIPLIASKEVNLNAILDILKPQADKIEMACFETLHAIYGSSAKSTFTFGKQVGYIEGILSALAIPYRSVQAKEWQKKMLAGVPSIKKEDNKTDTKAMAEVAFNRYFPDLYSKKITEGERDAALIALYSARY